ncbi:kinase-like protein [Coniochaeta ligniaria NRRL 30616]|uniref:Kinase-like protein n=1 Tax=Coniochaeta ligniaria NRRL 30616 TaxID=1408157 RepID=A0A1J7ISP1_9PEZI|nr:kinase-like protein [Coniochaeta ligniaria NRRL 30616]
MLSTARLSKFYTVNSVLSFAVSDLVDSAQPRQYIMVDMGDVRDINPEDGKIVGHLATTGEHQRPIHVMRGKGDFLGGGATGIVELLESGDVVKSPWTDPWRVSDCKADMLAEAKIYKRLGNHPRLVELKDWDPVDCVLTLGYMPHGTLKAFIEKNGGQQTISPAQRKQWAIEAAEGVELLHSHGVIHCDIGPHNFLLDDHLSLKICDFGGSSVDGSRASVVPGVRYRAPTLAGRTMQPATLKEDIFALGSTIYFVSTGHEVYNDLAEDDQVQKLYVDGVFPDLSGVLFGEAISLCWRQEVDSAKIVMELLGSMPTEDAQASSHPITPARAD